MSAKNKPSSLEPLADGDLLFRGERARRFNQALMQVMDARDSLASAAVHFPHQDLSDGALCGRTTVQAFTDLMEKHLFLLLSMVNSEDHKDYPEFFAINGGE